VKVGEKKESRPGCPHADNGRILLCVLCASSGRSWDAPEPVRISKFLWWDGGGVLRSRSRWRGRRRRLEEDSTKRTKIINNPTYNDIMAMGSSKKNRQDERVRDAYSVWNNVDEVDVKILEGFSMLGPRNLALISKHLDLPTTTVRYRVKRMLDDSILFLHLNPFHTNMGLRKAVLFIEAEPGYEDVLLDCLRVNDYWLSLYRLYGQYEGCGGTWTIPKNNVQEFLEFLQCLKDIGIARSMEVNWTTCHEGIPVKTRWYDVEDQAWFFDWDEWLDEVETIEGDLPWTLIEPEDWPIRVDYTDLLIIKELEINGRQSLTDISTKLGISFETVKYHFREHVSKRGLVEGYQIEIYRFPSLISEFIFFKFEFDDYRQFKKFTLSLHDKPFPIWMGKVIGENALMAQVYLPKRDFRRFISALSTLLNKGLLKRYQYFFEDMFQVWRETIPYQHFKNGEWEYDLNKMKTEITAVLEKWHVDK